ncbi:MAG: hypothetical protein WC091_21675 [Sulfuricellaceae bacterium]
MVVLAGRLALNAVKPNIIRPHALGIGLQPDGTTSHSTKETRIYSVLSFPRRRESSQIKHLDPHLLGDNELICVSLSNLKTIA